MLSAMKRIFVLILIFSTVSSLLFSQSIKELELQRKKMLESISLTNKLLNETQRSAFSTINRLTIVRKDIVLRQRLIENLNQEVTALDQTIDTLQIKHDQLQIHLTKLKNEYVRLLQESQMRQNSYSELLFLFSSQSISQAYRRLRYLKEFSDYRKQQAIEIIAVEEKVALQQQTLTQTRDAKEALRMQKEAESQKLKLEQQKENRTFLSLKGKEKNLHAQLSKQQRVANELNNKIEQLIAEEIRRSEERKREAARQAAAKQSKAPSHTVMATTPSVKTKESSVDFLTKEEQLVAGNFAANKGRLPWPVEKVVTLVFSHILFYSM